MAFPLLKGSCWWGVGLAQSGSPGWTTAPGRELKPPDVVAVFSIPPGCLRRGSAWSYTIQGGKVRFAANFDSNPQCLRDPQSLPPPNSLLRTILCSRYYDSHPPLQVRKNNIQRGKVTFLRRHSSSKGIHSYAGLMLLLMAFVGSLCSLTEAWWL